MLRSVFAWFLALLVFTPARVEFAPQHNHGSDQPDRMGTVHFNTSCSPEVGDEFDLAVATLHSFGAEYGAAVSAQEAGLRAAAERHYRSLLTNRSHADSDLPELTQANHFFGND
jgi:hypothetical protein